MAESLNLKEYCLRFGREELLEQWIPEKNPALSPESISFGSHRKVFWRCQKGHEWQAMVKSRVAGTGCPVCAGRAVVSGQNDLASRAPMLARQWHPWKNGSLTPALVTCGSSRKVWWRCSRGHEWQASIGSRMEGRGCPVCAGRQVVCGDNDLQSHFPGLAAQWLQERNGKTLPGEVSVYSNRRVWWQCPLGHCWQASVRARTCSKTGCPYCAGHKVLPGFNDLKTRAPLVAAQWHPSKNGPLEPSMVTIGSTRKVWWRCPSGHEWKAVVYSRAGVQRCGCPVCAGKTPRFYE